MWLEGHEGVSHVATWGKRISGSGKKGAIRGCSEQAGEWQEWKISYTREALLASVTLTFILYEMRSHGEGLFLISSCICFLAALGLCCHVGFLRSLWAGHPLWALASYCAGFSFWSRGSRAQASGVAHGPRCPVACGIFPDQGANSHPLHWQAVFTPGTPRESGSVWAE